MAAIPRKKVIHGGSGKAEREKTAKKVLDFSASVNPYAPAIRWECDPFLLEHYPDDSYSLLKDVIAETFHRKPEEICVGNGSIELIRTCCKVVLDGRRTFYTESPTFSEYAFSAELYGGKRVRRPAAADLRFICNPNNPTGSLRSRAEMLALLEGQKKPGSILCADEAFIELADPAQSLVADAGENLLVLRSLTKCFSVPGIRFGFGFGDPDLIGRIEAARLPWTVNAFAEAYALVALRHYHELEESRHLIAKERAFLERGLADIGFSCVPSSANFILVDTGKDVKGLCGRLMSRGILVRDCSSFELPTRIRVAVRTREENQILLEEIAACSR